MCKFQRTRRVWLGLGGITGTAVLMSNASIEPAYDDRFGTPAAATYA